MAKILVVDDALFMRKMLGSILVNAGHEIVAEAENAKEAIAFYKKFNPDLVTMDIIMPEIDKINALKAVIEIKKLSNDARIVIVSARGQEDIISEFIAAGAKDFIIKPFKKEEVIRIVTKELSQ